MTVKYPTHPIILLEPAVHLMLGAVLLARPPFEDPNIGLGVGTFFVVLGLVWGVPAVLRRRFGAFRLSEDLLTYQTGFVVPAQRQIHRSDVAAITPRRGARALRFDPVHASLSRFVDYGSVEIVTHEGGRFTLQPVNPAIIAAELENWIDERPLAGPTRQTRAWAPAVSGLVFVAFASAVLMTNSLVHASTIPILLTGAAICEVAFWISIANTRQSVAEG